jgi:transglutaminase-like putative cysteine protease
VTSQAWPALKALQSVEETRRQLRRPVSVLVTPSKKMNVLVSNSTPLSATLDSRVVFGPDTADITSLRPAASLDEGSQYRVDSTVSNASVERLRAATGATPAWTSAYKQLPSDLPPQILQKAREITAGATNPYDQATLIEQYIRTFPVDTTIKAAPGKRDSVAYFLFDIQRGYFDYHASAMVVMLRTLGIPSRLAVGYVIRPEDRDSGSNVYRVTEENAFAWPEVYFPSLGWVEFNPSPNEPRIFRLGTDDQALDDLGTALEEEVFPTGTGEPVEPAAEVVDQLVVDDESGVVGQVIASAILLLLVLTAVVFVVFQYMWQRGLGGLPYPLQVWEKTMRLSRWARIPVFPQETPRELTGRLKQELPEVSDIDFLGESFLRARYGQKDIAPAEKERLTSVWKKVRGTLVSRMFRWK